MTNDLVTTPCYDQDPSVRRAAIQGLVSREDSLEECTSKLNVLVSALSDPHISVQEAAANALLTFEPNVVAQQLIPLLHGNVQLRSIVVQIIQDLGPPVIPSLLPFLDDPNPHIRKFLTDILGAIGCADSVAGLLCLMGDSCANVRAAAAEALAHIGGDAAINCLMESIGDAEEWVTYSVIQALGELQAEQATTLLCRYLESSELAIQCAVVEALGKIGNRQVLPNLLAILPTAVIPLRHLLFVTIAGLVGEQSEVFHGPESREYLFSELVAALESREPEIQLAALKGIRLMGDSNATGALLQYLRQHDSSDEMIQTAVLQTLTEIGDETQLMQAAMDSEESVALRCIEALCSRRVRYAIPLLGQLVAHSGNREVRLAALKSLGLLEVGECQEIVMNAVNDQCGYIRAEAARIIGRMKIQSAHPLIIARLDQEPYPDVIEVLVEALTHITGTEDVPYAQILLSHPSPEVRAAVASHWTFENGETMTTVLLGHVNDTEWQVRLAVLEKLATLTLQPSLRKTFLQALSDPHPHIRQTAITALGNETSETIQGALYQILREDPDMWVVVRCVERLIDINDRSASPLFLELLPHAAIPVQVALARALGFFQYNPAVEALEVLLSAKVEEVREAAQWALEEIRQAFHRPRVCG